jgi:hypothetical protein
MLFGDNELVVNSAAIPHLKMHKRWVALSYHRVRWSIAAGISNIWHVAGAKNPSDILSKHWDMPSVWNVVQPLLFWDWQCSKPLSEEEEEKVSNTSEGDAKVVPKEGTNAIVQATTQSVGR